MSTGDFIDLVNKDLLSKKVQGIKIMRCRFTQQAILPTSVMNKVGHFEVSFNARGFPSNLAPDSAIFGQR